MTTTPVTEVRPGQRFLWCGRYVRVVSIEPYRPDGRRRSGRHGRYLVCEVAPGDTRSLHYSDDEDVTS